MYFHSSELNDLYHSCEPCLRSSGAKGAGGRSPGRHVPSKAAHAFPALLSHVCNSDDAWNHFFRWNVEQQARLTWPHKLRKLTCNHKQGDHRRNIFQKRSSAKPVESYALENRRFFCIASSQADKAILCERRRLLTYFLATFPIDCHDLHVPHVFPYFLQISYTNVIYIVPNQNMFLYMCVFLENPEDNNCQIRNEILPVGIVLNLNLESVHILERICNSD